MPPVQHGAGIELELRSVYDVRARYVRRGVNERHDILQQALTEAVTEFSAATVMGSTSGAR